MKSRVLIAIIAILMFTLSSTVKAGRGEEIDPAIKLLGKMVGGVWRTEGTFKAEFTYEWRVPGKAIRGLGKAAIGTPQEFPMEAMYGWDAAVKKVYYMDFHSNDTVYKGYATAEGNVFAGEFEGIIGDSGKYKFRDEFVDDDTLVAHMFAKNKAGEWTPLHEMRFKRHR